MELTPTEYTKEGDFLVTLIRSLRGFSLIDLRSVIASPDVLEDHLIYPTDCL